MVPRGEVGLIFAGVGAGLTLGGEPIFSRSVFTAIVLVVLVTTPLAPGGPETRARRARARFLAVRTWASVG